MRTKVILCLLLGLVLLSTAAIFLGKKETLAPVAYVTRDGQVLKEINLDKVDDPYFLVFEDESGTNTVLVEKGRICISKADCPDQICVNQGWISDGTLPIVCLPHKLMIQIADGGGGLDGTAG